MKNPNIIPQPNKIMINHKIRKSHYTKVMYFAQHNLLLYGKPESSYQYVVQVVMDMFDKYEQFLEVSLCQYELHVNNTYSANFCWSWVFWHYFICFSFITGKCLPLNLCNVSSG